MNLKNRFKHYFVVSLAAHIVVFSVLIGSASLQKNKTAQQNVEITLIDPAEINLSKKEIPEPKMIVESDSRIANDKLSEKAKYLSEKSNTVEKETRAKTGQKFVNSDALQKQVAAPRIQQQPIEPQPKPEKQNKIADQKPTKQNFRHELFDSGFSAYEAMNKQEQTANQQQQQKRQLAGAQKSTETSTTNDSLEGVQDDLITKLNTREYKYYGYYNRIKTQLNQWWVPQVQQKFTKMMKQGRTIASEENKVTKLVIVLNGEGSLVKVQVLAESGVRDLDDAAVEAFRQAAPFPNPPKGMIDDDGTVKIRWDCVVES